MNWDMPKVIGHNVRQRRLELKMDAADFGQEMQKLLGKPWKRQTVSALESGDRAMTANDVTILAFVLNTTPAQLFTPPAGMQTVQIGHVALDRSALSAIGPESVDEDALLSFEGDLNLIWSTLKVTQMQIQDSLEEVETLLKLMTEYRQTGKHNPGGITDVLDR